MNLEKTVQRLRETFDNQGYTLFYGTKNRYNLKKVIDYKQIIVEPISMRPSRSGACSYETSMTLWIGIRRELSAKTLHQDTGDDTEHISYMQEESSRILEALNSSDYIAITQTIDTIPLTYYESDSSQTVNSQSFIRIVIPVKIWIT
jgi:hypothetical protein